MDKIIKIAPSLLSANILHLDQEIQEVTAAGADWLHIDIMDGHYVPNITFGPSLVAAIAHTYIKMPIDVHLMITPAQPHIKAFANAGAHFITIHPDADIHTHRVLSEIRHHGAKAGIALNPSTPLCVLDYLRPFVDLILIMTVNPGFSGQSFIPEMLDKIAAVRQKIDHSGLPIFLEVDGGINRTTAPLVISAGADIIVAGDAIFGKKAHSDQRETYKDKIASLRQNMSLQRHKA